MTCLGGAITGSEQARKLDLTAEDRFATGAKFS
jgi:hypothetical protein